MNTITIRATAFDNVKVTKVEFYVDQSRMNLVYIIINSIS